MADALTDGVSATIRSALWAAYGDALGFISELTSEEGLRARIGATTVSRPVAWRRQIGGRFGAYAELPPGCYSDDTELRLATSRAIRGDGYFDVEAFAKIELPVWLSYALGGGRSTRAAATNLVRQDVNWFSNFFESRGLRYEQAGGNGGAMRVQPHVWAAQNKSDYRSFASDILRNTIVTHGHPRALVGSLFHAFCLAFALENMKVSGPSDWRSILESLPDYARLVREDGDLANFWLPTWESRIGSDIKEAFALIAAECFDDLSTIESILSEGENMDYEYMLRALDLLDDRSRGSATKTAIAAAALSWAYQDVGPERATKRAANVLSSDTDTIATMAGAILGSVATLEPDADLLDAPYIIEEASRLEAISKGARVGSFQYPNLMKWQPPQSQMDALVETNGECSIMGLGRVHVLGRSFPSRGRNDATWEWVRFHFGQTVLIKRRSKLPEVAEGDGRLPERHESPPKEDRLKYTQGSIWTFSPSQDEKRTLMSDVRNTLEQNISSLDEITKEVIRADFDPALIGRWLLRLSSQGDGIERAIAFAAIIAKARLARSKAHR